jgi:quercetin dioxygenase-like cupin family protein
LDLASWNTEIFRMPLPAQLIFATAATGKTYSAVGDKYTVLASGEQTGGVYSLTESIVPPGGGPPMHYHTRDEESFYVLEGEITFTVDDRTIIGTAGTFVQLPRGIPHCFKNNASASARMLILCSPPGFERFIAEFGTELPSPDAATIPPSPAEIEKLLSIAPNYGIVILPLR